MHDTGQYVMHADCGVCTSGLGTLNICDFSCKCVATNFILDIRLLLENKHVA